MLAWLNTLDYAKLFAGDYMAIDDGIFAELARWLSVADIVELNMFCALMLAGGRMTYVQCAYEAETSNASNIYSLNSSFSVYPAPH